MVLYVSEPEMLARFVDGLKVAAGSAHQLAHAQENPDWLKIRDLLETMIDKGRVLATSKSKPRQEVLVDLALREADARSKNDTN